MFPFSPTFFLGRVGTKRKKKRRKKKGKKRKKKGENQRKFPLFHISRSLEHKNHLTLWHKPLLAPASCIPRPACPRRGGDQEKPGPCELLSGAAPADTSGAATAGPARGARPRKNDGSPSSRRPGPDTNQVEGREGGGSSCKQPRLELERLQAGMLDGESHSRLPRARS